MSNTHTHSTIDFQLEQALRACIEYCKEFGSAFACWKNPKQDTIRLLLDFNGAQRQEKLNLETSKTGFIISAFDKNDDTLFLENHLLLEWEDRFSIKSENHINAEHFIDFITQFKQEETGTFRLSEQGLTNSSPYTALVEQAIAVIKSEGFSKVVPSRYKKVEYSGHLDIVKNFKDLCRLYENAFVSVHFTEQFGLWMGATPEMLLETEGNIFRTVSLAGTQAFDQNQHLGDVAWTQKEIEEQALVSRYIIDCFKTIRLREFIEKGPKTVKAGNLIHLKTTYEVDMNAVNFKELGTTMLHLLHPTSAVCGMPLEESLAFILKNENYDRELYSGYLGPINFNEKTSIYVNLRCMKIDNKTLTLFAGAGVTEDSIPSKEWQETEMKMNTLLNVITAN